MNYFEDVPLETLLIASLSMDDYDTFEQLLNNKFINVSSIIDPLVEASLYADVSLIIELLRDKQYFDVFFNKLLSKTILEIDNNNTNIDRYVLEYLMKNLSRNKVISILEVYRSNNQVSKLLKILRTHSFNQFINFMNEFIEYIRPEDVEFLVLEMYSLEDTGFSGCSRKARQIYNLVFKIPNAIDRVKNPYEELYDDEEDICDDE